MRLRGSKAITTSAICAILLSASAPIATPQVSAAVRVCAEPNNLPFSNIRKEGFENKLAELVARDLGKQAAFVWTMERNDSIAKALRDGRCDVVMGIPAAFNAAETTQPYYTSGYVFVYRKRRVSALRSIKDPRLKTLKIGVHLIGDDSAPPTEALARQGIVTNVSGFMIYADTSKPNPPARLIEAVESGAIDVATVWGPIGGYFAHLSPTPLSVTPIQDTESFAPLQFRYAIAMGVRKGDHTLKAALNAAISKHAAEIRNLLLSYGVPLVEARD